MNKRNNLGFTLIELLATILVLAIVVGLSVYGITVNINKVRERTYKITIKNIESNVSSYLLENKDKLLYISKNENTEYQCITVQNLIDFGYLDNTVTSSPVKKDRNVLTTDYIYIERNSTTKVINKNVYIYDDSTSYGTDCTNAPSVFSDITFAFTPGLDTWSKEKEVTITYKLKNVDSNIGDLTYNYTYTNSNDITCKNGCDSNNDVKKVNVKSKGIISAEILHNGIKIAGTSQRIDKIDNVGPEAILIKQSDTAYNNNVLSFSIKLNDDASGVDNNSFTKDDINLQLGTNTITNFELTNKGNDIYTIKINDFTWNDDLSLTIDNDKFTDKAGNGNNKIIIKLAYPGKCRNLTYNGNNQTLVSGGQNVTYENNSKKNVGSYKVTINANSGYKFIDNTTSTSLTCSIATKVKETGNVTLSPNSGTHTYGENGESIIQKYGDGELSCRSSNESVVKCSISGTTLIILPQPVASDNQVALITVSLSEGENYTGASATYTATVNRKEISGCPDSPVDKTYTGSSQNSGIICPTHSQATGDTSAKNAGTYTETCTEDAGYKFATTCSVTWKINKKDVSITEPEVVSTTLTYNGNNQELLSEAGTCSDGGTMYWYKDNPTKENTTPSFDTDTWTSTAPTSYKVKDAGTYHIWYYCRVTDTNNYSGSDINTPLSIDKKINDKVLLNGSISLSPTSGTLTYGTNKTSTITKNGDGTLSCTSSDESIATCSISDTTLTITPKANTSDSKVATITVTLSEGENYTGASATYSATVNRKTLACPDSPADKTYTGSSQNSGVTCPTDSTAGGDKTGTNVATYSQTCTATKGYKFNSACSVTWKIVNANPTCPTITSYSGPYDNNSHTFTVSGGANGTVKYKTSGDENYGISKPSRTNAGTTSVSVKMFGNDNYNDIDCGDATITINKKSIAVSWDSESNYPYTGNNVGPNATASTGINDEAISINTTKASAIGTHTSTATCSGVSGGQGLCTNYTLTNTTKTFTIYNAVTEVNIPTSSLCASRTYTGSEQNLVSTTGSGYILTNNMQTNAGTYTITATLTNTTDYKWSDGTTGAKTFTCTMNRKAISEPTCSDKEYSGGSQTLFTNGTGYTAGGTTSGTNLGTYTATATPTNNYEWSSGSDKTSTRNITCKIVAKNITISWGSTNLQYNGAAQGPTCNSSTGISGETISINCHNPGYTNYHWGHLDTFTAEAECTNVSGGSCSNYNITNPTTNYTIGKKTITVTWGSTNLSFNEQAQGPTCSASTGISGEEMTLNCFNPDAPSTDGYYWGHVGTHNAEAECKSVTGGGADCSRYDLTNNTTTYTIAEAKPKAKITCQDKTYTGGVQVIATCSGGSAANHYQVAVGSYKITCTGDSTHSDATPKYCSIYANNSGGGGGCFLAGTKVMTMMGYKDIDKIKYGEMILTYNEKLGINEYHSVVNLFKFMPNEINESLYTLSFDDKTTLQVSSTHRFYIKRNNEYLWLPTKEIKIGDNVKYVDGTYHKIINMKNETLTKTVYNLTVDNTHNFYVGNQLVLVHNVGDGCEFSNSCDATK